LALHTISGIKNGLLKKTKVDWVGRVSFGFLKGFGNNFLDGLDIG